MNADGANATQLTYFSFQDFSVEADDPAWSPDGDSLTFISNFKTGTYLPPKQLYTMTPSVTDLYRVNYNGTDTLQPAYKPDNSHIAYSALNYASIPNIHQVTPDGAAPSALTNGFVAEYHPTYSLDGAKIAYDSNSQIAVMTNSGASVVTLTSEGSNTDPTWAAGEVVLPVNQAPINSVPTTQSIIEDRPLIFNTFNNNRILVSDADAGTSAVKVTLGVNNGTLSLSGISGLTFTSGDGSADATMSFSGSLSAINAALDNLKFMPTLNFFGQSTLTLTTNDGGNTGTGGPKSDTDTIAITVLSVNDEPTLNALGDLTINEDAAQKSVALSGIGDGGDGVAPISITATSDNTSLVANPTIIYSSPGATGTLNFTPVANAKGSAKITVSVKDSGGTSNGGVDTVTRTFVVEAMR
jgi:hypothetical protein